MAVTNRVMAHPHTDECEACGERWQDRIEPPPSPAVSAGWPEWLMLAFLGVIVTVVVALIYIGVLGLSRLA